MKIFMKFKKIRQLLISFLKIGMIAFGGGYAVAPLLQKEIVEHRKWITSEELTDMMAISQALPGIIFTNSATMIGYRVAGLWGAIVSTIASITPTFAITLIITTFFWDYIDNPWIKKILTGVLLGVTALILYAMVKMWKSAIKNYFHIIMVALSSVLLIIFKTNAVFVILVIAIIGFSFNMIIFKLGGNK